MPQRRAAAAAAAAVLQRQQLICLESNNQHIQSPAALLNTLSIDARQHESACITAVVSIVRQGPHFLEHLNLNVITVDENFHCNILHSILDALEHLNACQM